MTAPEHTHPGSSSEKIHPFNKRCFSACAGESATAYMSQLLSQPKRMRFEAEDDLTDDSEDEEANHQIRRAGYIKKLTLKNFMCHDHFELSFGPHMNFIIGRNGSGKSAVLTGISVGLGAKATDTDRGSSAKSLIKNGKSTAKILVEIENGGLNAFEPEIYGGSILVERKLTREGQNTYAIKSENGTLVSNKKKTLDEILQRFFIAVSNPLSFLSQDKARKFISSSSEQSRYTHFAEGTNIESIINNYDEVSGKINHLQRELDYGRQSFKELSTRFLQAERLYKKYKQSHTLREQSEKLHGKIYWFNVIVQERKITKREAEVTEEQNKIQCIEQTIKGTQNTIKVKEAEGDQLYEQKKQADQEFQEKRDEHLEAEASYEAATSKVQSIVSDLKSYKGDVDHYNKDLKKHEADLNSEQKKIDDANGGSKQAMSQKLELLKTHEDKLTRERNSTHEELNQKLAKSPEVISLEDELREVSQTKRMLQGKIESAKEAKNNQYAAFGLNLKKLMVDLEKIPSWHQKPVGPVGCFVSVKKEFAKWGDVINATLQRTLDSFVVCNEHDRRLLSGIMKKNNIHKSVIVRRFEKFGFNNQTSSRFCTMLNALEFQNEDAKFTLIDSMGIEEIVICESISEAEEATRSSFVKQAVCLNDRTSGIRFTRRDGHLARDPVFYSRELNKLAGKVDSKTFINDLEEVQKQEELLLDKKRKLDSKEREAKMSLQREFESKKAQLKKIKDSIFRAQAALADEGDHARIAYLLSQIEICQNQIKTREGMSLELLNTLTEHKAELKGLKGNVESLKKLRDLLAKNLESCENEVNRHLTSIQDLKDEVRHLENEKRTTTEKTASLMNSIAEDKQTLEDLVVSAEGQCPRSNVNIVETDTAKSITAEYTSIQRAIEEMERQNETPFEDVQRELMNAKTLKDNCEQNLLLIEKARMDLENDLNSRFENLNITIREKLMKAKHSFESSLELRGFKGKLEFDFTNKKVITEVQTEENKETRAVSSLSGGEKSFTQIAFLLSIWKVMKPRVCGLDEFDVFMDSVNRTIAIRLLMHELRGSAAQSIFITPQDIAGVGDLRDSEDIKIHRISAPRDD